VIRFNGYPAADFSGGTNPAVLSSTEAVTVVQGLRNRCCRAAWKWRGRA
jgi:hypothetical protein